MSANLSVPQSRLERRGQCRWLGPAVGLPESGGRGENLHSNQIAGDAVARGPGNTL